MTLYAVALGAANATNAGGVVSAQLREEIAALAAAARGVAFDAVVCEVSWRKPLLWAPYAAHDTLRVYEGCSAEVYLAAWAVTCRVLGLADAADRFAAAARFLDDLSHANRYERAAFEKRLLEKLTAMRDEKS